MNELANDTNADGILLVGHFNLCLDFVYDLGLLLLFTEGFDVFLQHFLVQGES